MEIHKLNLSDLAIDTGLSGRSEKEIAENAKALAPLLLAAGGWDPAQPGQFFVRNGKKHLAAGFTRCAATLLNGHGQGWFVEIPGDPEKIRTACIRTNLGKPVSQYEQGRIYAGMRDGNKAEDVSVGQPVLEPMAIKDIAAEVGYTRQHVENCIAIFEETPEIATLILSGAISPNIATRAKQMVKDDEKRYKMLHAAVLEAQKDGKQTATMKHLDAVKPDFVKLKAASTKVPSNPEPTPLVEAAPEKPSPIVDSEPDTEHVSPEPEPRPLVQTISFDANLLFADSKSTPALSDRYAESIDEWGRDRGVVFSEADRDNLVNLLLALPF